MVDIAKIELEATNEVYVDELHDFLSSFLLGLSLAVDGRISDVAERDAGLATQRSPDGPRQVK